MPDFEKMYLKMAARMADITDMAIAAQREAEEIYYQTSHDPVDLEVWKKQAESKKDKDKEEQDP